MNKLQKYNQLLFSIIGTVVLILLLILGIKLLIDLFDRPTYTDNSLIPQEELDSLKKDNLRNQVISLEGVQLFDSISSSYIIPVSHKNLDEPMSRNQGILGIMKSELDDYSYYGGGNYNNLILYSFSDSSSKILLDERVSINQYTIVKSKNRKLIVLSGWNKDTNNDGKLNSGDFKQYYLYNHKTSQVVNIKNGKYIIHRHEYLRDVEQLIFYVTDLENEIEDIEKRPEYIVSYSFENNSLKPLVDLTTLNKIQQIIDN